MKAYIVALIISILALAGAVVWANHTTHAQGSMMGIPGVPSGVVIMMLSNSCPNELWSQVTQLNGKFPIGTLIANNDVGGTGGSSSITPTGTISPQTFTGQQQNFGTALNVSLLGLGTALTGPASITPAGTVSQATFTGNAFDPTPQYVKVIYCKKN